MRPLSPDQLALASVFGARSACLITVPSETSGQGVPDPAKSSYFLHDAAENVFRQMNVDHAFASRLAADQNLFCSAPKINGVTLTPDSSSPASGIRLGRDGQLLYLRRLPKPYDSEILASAVFCYLSPADTRDRTIYADGRLNPYSHGYLHDVQPGDRLFFSRGHFTAGPKGRLDANDKGTNSYVIDIGHDRVLKVMRHPHLDDTKRDFRGFLTGWREVYDSEVPTIRLYEEESCFPEYLVVEYVDIETSLARFLEGVKGKTLESARERSLWDRFLEFSVSTWQFAHIGDFHAKQIVYSPSRESWILLDFNDEHEKAGRKAPSLNAFQMSRSLFGHFWEIPDDKFLEMNRRISRARLRNGLPQSSRQDFVPEALPPIPAYLLDDY